MEFITTLMRLEGSRLHGSITKRLSGNAWVDSAGYVAVYTIFMAGIPLIRANWPHIQQQLQARGVSLFYGARNSFETTIRFQKEQNKLYREQEESSDDSEEGKRNNILQKAILLYIGHLDLDYRRCLASLTAIKQKPSAGPIINNLGRPQVSKVFGGTAEQLKSFNIHISPPEQIWVEVDKENGVWFKQVKEVEDVRPAPNTVREPITTIGYSFWCAGPRGNDKVKAFIQRAYNWYVEKIESTEDNARYMYSLVAKPKMKRMTMGRAGPEVIASSSGSPSSKSRSSTMRYKRYKLGDVKEFNSLFFPEKDNLLKILANFEAKTGKYQVPGYPYKLGLLLHGPPGTGKTSLIKALACRTRRHIVQVPLGRIETNEDLMNIMFDQSFLVLNQQLPVSLNHENIIYVFEDVDAASHIVQRRNNVSNQAVERKSPPANAAEANSNHGVAIRGIDAAIDGDESGNEYDKLNLSGLLNVLDGVVDTPGRIVVMTTNIVGALDEALIRPGRIDKKILLGFMKYEAALQMTMHFFPEEGERLTDKQKRRLKAVFTEESAARRRRPSSNYSGSHEGQLTPATVEQLLGEYEKVDDFLEALEWLALENPESTNADRSSVGVIDFTEVNGEHQEDAIN